MMTLYYSFRLRRCGMVSHYQKRTVFRYKIELINCREAVCLNSWIGFAVDDVIDLDPFCAYRKWTLKTRSMKE